MHIEWTLCMIMGFVNLTWLLFLILLLINATRRSPCDTSKPLHTMPPQMSTIPTRQKMFGPFILADLGILPTTRSTNVWYEAHTQSVGEEGKNLSALNVKLWVLLKAFKFYCDCESCSAVHLSLGWSWKCKLCDLWRAGWCTHSRYPGTYLKDKERVIEQL